MVILYQDIYLWAKNNFLYFVEFSEIAQNKAKLFFQITNEKFASKLKNIHPTLQVDVAIITDNNSTTTRGAFCNEFCKMQEAKLNGSIVRYMIDSGIYNMFKGG